MVDRPLASELGKIFLRALLDNRPGGALEFTYMKWLCVTILAAGAALLGWPLLNENAGSTCSAVEDLAARQFVAKVGADPAASPSAVMWGNLLANGVTALSQGKIAATGVKQAHPNLPPFLGCTILYYQHVANPSLAYAITPATTPVAIPAPNTTSLSKETNPAPVLAIPAPSLVPSPDEITTPSPASTAAATPVPINLFTAYPAGPVYTGPHAAPDLTEPQNYDFRTRIRAASHKTPNFAGRWVLVNWGCGTGCNDGRLVNTATGTVLSLPAAVISGTLPEPTADVYTYTRESRLLIVNGHDGESDTTPYRTRCYVLEDGVSPELIQQDCSASATPYILHPNRREERSLPQRVYQHSGVAPWLSRSNVPNPVPTAPKCFTVYPALPPADCFAH
jgi:hypothetical protein